ncbi:MAG: hypothetical protein AB7F25_11955 [Deferribacterales bacterium]
MASFRVAFTGSHSRSATFAHIAKNLAEQGADVYFIMPGAKYRIKYLTDMGFDRSRILDLAEADKSYDADALSIMESCSRVTAAHMIMNDRLLCKKQGKEAYGYLGGVFKSVSKFITDNRIDIVFSEATWAYELAVCSACEHTGAKFIVPHGVRIPNGRFGFFSGIFQDNLVRLNNAEKTLPKTSELFVLQAPVQCRLFSNRNFIGFIKHMGRFLRRTAEDETEQSVFDLTAERVKRAVNMKMSGFYAMQTVPESDYVYMPLHISPEASLDVLGGLWQNQLELVRNVARSLPHGMVVAVREHPAGVGRRHYSFFRETRKLPNVVNISPFADGMELIMNAKAVVSVSGSACYEAAFAGVGSVVFSDVFFSELPTVFRCRSTEELKYILAEAISVRHDEQALAEFLADITANSYEGCVDSADMNPLATEKENARIVSQAFMKIIKYYSSSEKSL